jgi:hypothetical protein
MAPEKRRPFQAFTLEAKDGRLRALNSEIHVCAAFDPATLPSERPEYCSFRAIWDTGATGCVITSAVVKACDLKPVGQQEVHGAYGGAVIRDTFLVNLVLPNHVPVQNITVVEGDLVGVDVLIGMDVITNGDFAITHADGKTVFTFRIPSCERIDYVKEARQQRLLAGRDPGGDRPPVNPAARRKKGRR